MKSIFLKAAFIAALCASAYIPAQAQLTTITASSIKIGGVAIASGTVAFTPVNAIGNPIPFATGGGGLNSPQAFSCTITTGAITGTCQIPDSELTTPANILYTALVTNTAVVPSVSFTVPVIPNITGTTWAFDDYGPATPATNVQVVQSAVGTNVPTYCIMPSIFTKTSSSGALYYCLNGLFVLASGSSGTTYTGTSPIVVIGSTIGIQTATDMASGAMSAADHAALTATIANATSALAAANSAQATANSAQTAIGNYLLLSGGTLTGSLTLPTINASSFGTSPIFTGTIPGIVPAAGSDNSSAYYLGGDAAFHAVPSGSGGVAAGTPPGLQTLTDATTIAYNEGGVMGGTALLNLNHSVSSRTLNVTGLVTGSSTNLLMKQDSTGGVTTITLGTCNSGIWYVGGSAGFVTAGTLTLTSTAGASNIASIQFFSTNCYVNLR